MPYHHDHGGRVAVGIYVNPGPIQLGGGPGPAEVVSVRDLGPAEAAALVGEAPAPPPAEPPAVVAEAEVAPLTQVALPPLAPFPLDERGFFADDALVLELTLVDAATGEPRWQKWVEEEADVRDREAVKRILDRALGEAEGWAAVR